MGISATTITPVRDICTKKGEKIDVEANEEQELRLDDPILNEAQKNEFPEQLLKQGMNQEMQSMKDFRVYEEIYLTHLTPEQQKKIIKTRWVLR